MRVGLMQEGHCPEGTTRAQRYHEMIRECLLAEEAGFDLYGNGEQHFGKFTAIVSSPEITHSYLAAKTSRIRFRAMSVNMLAFNHPIRIAEQLATMDVVSNGRMELGGARSNNPWTLDAFGIDPRETRAHRDEALRIIGKALSMEEFEHHSELYDLPPRTISPRPIQQPAPPIHISATGVVSHANAGQMGIGVMTGNSILGWDYAQDCIDAYKAAITDADPLSGEVVNRLGFFSTGVGCFATREEAKEHAGPVALRFVEVVMSIYTDLSAKSPDYAYLGQIERLRDRMTDLDYLMDAAPYITMGTPDDLIERARVLHGMGADEVLWRVDGMGHEANKRTIEMIGEHVIPVLHDFPEHENATPATRWAPQGDNKEDEDATRSA
jgi:alkanesulfonate monooxygenase SsuD/methylene tetrahydromethanopterin reductase-like flavin-dependent oxidoreductase (luciferase family)